MNCINQRIKTKKETSARRADMSVCCYELKIQENKLSTKQYQKLIDYFKQAKYLTNSIIGSKDVFNYDYKTKQVEIKWKENNIEKTETKNISLPSQIKQDIKTKIITNILNLNKAKKKGMKVGKLKFRKEINSIGLKQFGCTWKFGPKNKVHIAGVGFVKVNGIDQIPKDISEFGCAKLIRKSTGYFVQITGFKPKDQIQNMEIDKSDIVGLDFGIKDDITLSTGEKINFDFNTNNIIREQKRLSKKKKGSKNRFKQILKLKKQHQKLVNKKNDTSNKFVSTLKNKYKLICIQDENIKGWHSGFFGKQVQHSILGRIKSKLMKLNTTLVVDRFQPSTKLCPMCGSLNKLKLNDRIYKCSCGFCEDRDIKSAKLITVLALNQYIGTEHTNFKPVEILTSGLSEKYNILFNNIKLESLNQEAPIL